VSEVVDEDNDAAERTGVVVGVSVEDPGRCARLDLTWEFFRADRGGDGGTTFGGVLWEGTSYVKS